MVDLVLATRGRTDEPRRFLSSLSGQTYREFRLIVVDQNPDDRLDRILSDFGAGIEILRLRSEPGLSRARNVGLEHLAGDLAGFPDDDCWYEPDVLERVAAFFVEHPAMDGIGGRAVDEDGRAAAGGADMEPGPMTMFNLWRRVASFTLFVRHALIETVGQFDETLGVGSGSPWGGGEDLDYVARCLRAGRAVYYEPSLVVRHPRKREGVADPNARDGYAYGAGYGRALRKNRLPAWFAAYMVGRSFGASLLSLLRANPRLARFYWAVGRGRVGGWRSTSTSS